MRASWHKLAGLLGLDVRRLPWRKRWISGVGRVVAIALVLVASRAVVGDGAGWTVASMGASTVLLFAVPHSPLSQPWQVVAGHLVPAVIGVAWAGCTSSRYYPRLRGWHPLKRLTA